MLVFSVFYHFLLFQEFLLKFYLFQNHFWKAIDWIESWLVQMDLN